jgi:HemK-like putative methylase
MTQDEAWLLRDKYHGVTGEAFERDRVRLRNGEPLAYVIGWTPFLHTRILLTSHPLIPRPETEYWVDRICGEMRDRHTLRVLDLCAGSGCIGVAILTRIPNARVDFAELDEHHHQTIEANVTENSIDSSRTRVLGGDLFERVHDRYDYILSNPPYIDPVIDRTSDSVRTHEPHAALYGGTLGMTLIEKIIADAPQYLVPGGILVIEHEPEQSPAIHTKAHEAGFESETYTDQFGLERFSRLCLSA